jgi:hypothetical protein
MGLRQRCQQVYQAGLKLGKKSVRALGRQLNLSKSSIHRHQQRIKHRNQYPESNFWESPEGYQWLRLLVFATIYIFGIKQAIGSLGAVRVFASTTFEFTDWGFSNCPAPIRGRDARTDFDVPAGAEPTSK